MSFGMYFLSGFSNDAFFFSVCTQHISHYIPGEFLMTQAGLCTVSMHGQGLWEKSDWLGSSYEAVLESYRSYRHLSARPWHFNSM